MKLSKRERDVEVKNKQMLIAKSLPLDKAQDLLLTLIWKSKTALVQRCLIERGFIDPTEFLKVTKIGAMK